MSEEKLVNFHLDIKLYHELKMLAARENRPIKDILHEEIEKYVKIHKDGNPQHLITNYAENTDFIGFPSIAIDKLKKESWLKNYGLQEDSLNPLGRELWGHVCQWYYMLKDY